MSELGLIMYFSSYLRSAMVRLPLITDSGVCRTSSATPGMLIIILIIYTFPIDMKNSPENN